MNARRPRLPVVLLSAVLLASLVTTASPPPPVRATIEPATPPSDSIGSADPSTTWTGPDKNAETSGPEACGAQVGLLFPPYCSDFSLTMIDNGVVDVSIVGSLPAEDFDLYVYDASGQQVGSSAFLGGIEATSFCASTAADPYLVRTVYFTTADHAPAPDDSGYTGSAEWSAAGPGDCPTTPANAIFSGQTLTFAPSTLVSAHFLGSEPMTVLERRLPGIPSGVTDPNRIFVDWPLSSRSQMGQLSRSLDAGDSFRHNLDLRCWDRNRPNCLTGGGGDTDSDVNLHTGTVLFSDQEVVVNESMAASFDHGDSFISQTLVTGQTTATDRQWLAVTDASYGLVDTDPATQAIEGFLAYHVPCAGQYIHGIQRVNTLTGPVAQPIPQPVPQLFNVGQSGMPRVDNNTASPGYRWIYQPYFTCVGNVPPVYADPAGSLTVATAHGPDYASPLAWKSNFVSTDTPDIFSWNSIDSAGNAYVVWTSTGVMYLTASPIGDPRNNPDLEAGGNTGADSDNLCNRPDEVCGRPGSYWTPQVRVSLPQVTSAVFPQMIAGSPGRIGINYVGTTQPLGGGFTGLPDTAPPETVWNVYAAVITNATMANGQPPTVATGIVSHRYVHMGNICTGGVGCAAPLDRSLLDMIDLGYDQNGRLGVVFTDNFSHAFHENPGGEDESPFTYFAKQLSGPSVMSARALRGSQPSGSCRSDAEADATWPNIAGAPNLPSLDERGFCLTVENNQLVARIVLRNASVGQMQNDLVAFNTANTAPTVVGPCVSASAPAACVADRLQYVVRFNTADETYHLSMEFLPTGARRFFAGLLDENDFIYNPGNPTSSGVLAAGYHTDPDFAATGQVTGNTITIRVPLANLGLSVGARILSATAFSTAGPLEAPPAQPAFTRLANDVMRTVDAAPPLDLTLRRGGGGGGGGGDDDDPVVVTTKTGPAQATPGETFTYTIGYTNVGPAPVSNARITDRLPPELQFVSASAGGSYSSSTRAVTWNLGTVPVAASGSVTLLVQVNANASPGTAVVNQANFTGRLTVAPPTAVWITWIFPE